MKRPAAFGGVGAAGLFRLLTADSRPGGPRFASPSVTKLAPSPGGDNGPIGPSFEAGGMRPDRRKAQARLLSSAEAPSDCRAGGHLSERDPLARAWDRVSGRRRVACAGARPRAEPHARARVGAGARLPVWGGRGADLRRADPARRRA